MNAGYPRWKVWIGDDGRICMSRWLEMPDGTREALPAIDLADDQAHGLTPMEMTGLREAVLELATALSRAIVLDVEAALEGRP